MGIVDRLENLHILLLLREICVYDRVVFFSSSLLSIEWESAISLLNWIFYGKWQLSIWLKEEKKAIDKCVRCHVSQYFNKNQSRKKWLSLLFLTFFSLSLFLRVTLRLTFSLCTLTKMNSFPHCYLTYKSAHFVSFHSGPAVGEWCECLLSVHTMNTAGRRFETR